MLKEKPTNLYSLGRKNYLKKKKISRHFYKLKEVYSHIKLVINRCQDVANILKGIVLEYS